MILFRKLTMFCLAGQFQRVSFIERPNWSLESAAASVQDDRLAWRNCNETLHVKQTLTRPFHGWLDHTTLAVLYPINDRPFSTGPTASSAFSAEVEEDCRSRVDIPTAPLTVPRTFLRPDTAVAKAFGQCRNKIIEGNLSSQARPSRDEPSADADDSVCPGLAGRMESAICPTLMDHQDPIRVVEQTTRAIPFAFNVPTRP